jgi:hypothetical protein
MNRLLAIAERRPWTVFLLIFAIAFAIRFGFLIFLPHDKIIDAGEASSVARALLTNHSFADPYSIPTGSTAHLNPFFPGLLALIELAFGQRYAGAIVRCAVLIASYSLLYALFPALAIRFGMPRRAGIIAGFAAALLPVRPSAEIYRGWEEPFAALALVGCLLLAHRLAKEPSLRRSLIFGLAAGGALYISAALALPIASIAIVDIVSNRNRKTILRWTAAAVIATLSISPWLIRNRAELGEWVFMRDNLGLELRFSNHPGARPSFELMHRDPASNALHPSFSRAEAAKVLRLGEVEYNHREMALFTAYVAGHPGGFAVLSLQHFFYFWFGPLEHWPTLVVTTAYTLLGLFALPLLRRTSGNTVFRIWCAALVAYPLLYYFVQYVNRYRVPVDWMIWLLAGLLLAQMTYSKDSARISISESPESIDTPLDEPVIA